MKKKMKSVCLAILAIALSAGSKAQNLGDVVLANGLTYIGTPYVASVLDREPTEELTINADELDCMTFVEYVLAESLCPKLADGDILESDFANKVQQIRYRDGKVKGYSSRLHYGTDWIDNAIRQHILWDVTAQNSQATQVVEVSYMTEHPDQYRQLSDARALSEMKQVEQALSGEEIHYLPKKDLPYNGEVWIKNGDVIAITTDRQGLDIAHFGIAFYVEGKLTLLHASSDEKKVVVSSKTLSQMLNDHDDWTGIRVLRIVE